MDIFDLIATKPAVGMTRREALRRLGSFLGVGALVPEHLTAIPKPVPAGEVAKKLGFQVVHED